MRISQTEGIASDFFSEPHAVLLVLDACWHRVCQLLVAENFDITWMQPSRDHCAKISSRAAIKCRKALRSVRCGLGSNARSMPHKPIEAMTEGAAGLSGNSPVIKKRELSWSLLEEIDIKSAAVGFIRTLKLRAIGAKSAAHYRATTILISSTRLPISAPSKSSSNLSPSRVPGGISKVTSRAPRMIPRP
jgi:hypothetical protein